MVSFDRQSVDFDQRAGLPAGAARRIAVAVAELAPADGRILDLGAGTGQIGEHLAGADRSYLGLDVSGPMLAIFHHKLGKVSAPSALLVRADGAVRWPLARGSVDVVFLSRAAHLLPPSVLVEEASRVIGSRGGMVVFGGVRSEPQSLRAQLRRQMRRLLAEHGVEGRRAETAQRQLADALVERGGELLPEKAAASWAVVERPRKALAAWRAKAGLAGRTVSAQVQETVLRRLEEWAVETFGSLDAERDATERYELTAIRLPRPSQGNQETNLQGARR